MPSILENYSCHVCAKRHTLYFAGPAAPGPGKLTFYICPGDAFAIRVTTGDGWKPVDARPKGSLELICGDEAGRAEL